jgi:hypothetical protein
VGLKTHFIYFLLSFHIFILNNINYETTLYPRTI